MNLLSKDLLEEWTRPGPRLPDTEACLLRRVWTKDRFKECGASPSRYLKSGEQLVNEREALLTAAAGSIFDELVSRQLDGKTVPHFFSEYPDGAAVVFDGCSLREIPRLLDLAGASKRPVLSVGCCRSAFPSSTEYFVADRLGFGLPVLGPSQLTGRRELREQGVAYYYFQAPSEFQTVSSAAGPAILWSRFPDLRFMDSSANSADMYDGIWDVFDLAWKNTVQALPPGRTILVTSDHGYVFLGAGLSDQSLEGKDRVLHGKRCRKFGEDESLPENDPYIWVDPDRRIGAIKGRCHNRPQAPSASRSIYRHGGISLMEVLTPWLVLGPMEE
jgi:hypothetical protein